MTLRRISEQVDKNRHRDTKETGEILSIKWGQIIFFFKYFIPIRVNFYIKRWTNPLFTKVSPKLCNTFKLEFNRALSLNISYVQPKLPT